jgi:hypothetical protein
VDWAVFYSIAVVYIYNWNQPEDGCKKRKNVAESCKFIKYLIKRLC